MMPGPIRVVRELAHRTLALIISDIVRNQNECYELESTDASQLNEEFVMRQDDVPVGGMIATALGLPTQLD